MRITFVAAAVFFFWGPTPVEEGMQIRRPRRRLLLLCRASSFISMCASYIYKHIHPEKKEKEKPPCCLCVFFRVRQENDYLGKEEACTPQHRPPTKKNGKKCLFYFKSFFLGRVVEMSGDERHVAGQDAEKYIFFYEMSA